MKKFVLIFTTVFLLCRTVSGANVLESEYSDGTYRVSGIANSAQTPVKIEVFEDGVVYSDISQVTSDHMMHFYKYMDQQYTDMDKKFTFTVPIGTTAGNHYVKVSFIDGDEYRTAFYTYSDSETATALNDFMADDNKTVLKLKQLIVNYCLGINVDLADFKSLSDEKQLECLHLALENLKTTDDITKCVNAALGFEIVSENGEKNDFIRYEKYFKLSDSGYYDDWKKLSDSEKENICCGLKGTKTPDDLERALENGIIVRTLANETWNNISHKLNEYKENISLDLSEVENLSDENQKNVYVALKTALEEGLIDSIEDIKLLLDELSNEYKKTPGGSAVNKGFGNGGGGVTGFVSAATAEAIHNNGVILPFDDISHLPWAVTSIVKLNERGIVNGKGNRLFVPDAYVSREEFTAMIVRAFAMQLDDAENMFVDITDDRWSSTYIKAAKARGIVNGTDRNHFSPEAQILRCDMAVIAYNAAVQHNAKFENGVLEQFGDKEDVPEYAVQPVAALTKAGIIKGNNGKLFPNSFATRAEAVAVIYRMMEYCGITD